MRTFSASEPKKKNISAPLKDSSEKNLPAKGHTEPKSTSPTKAATHSLKKTNKTAAQPKSIPTESVRVTPELALYDELRSPSKSPSPHMLVTADLTGFDDPFAELTPTHTPAARPRATPDPTPVPFDNPDDASSGSEEKPVSESEEDPNAKRRRNINRGIVDACEGDDADEEEQVDIRRHSYEGLQALGLVETEKQGEEVKMRYPVEHDAEAVIDLRYVFPPLPHFFLLYHPLLCSRLAFCHQSTQSASTIPILWFNPLCELL